eukprot:TRINITY_DN15375_c0_g2_i1.p1 TRINITY_DN15375_c0_g2~~TRINITY_DN15375_c0_g2_i1.p1  ORF type:complete len:517 (-),score=52.98 TRINITY_DN15375_c0_g2_i1:31-1581(-)
MSAPCFFGLYAVALVFVQFSSAAVLSDVASVGNFEVRFGDSCTCDFRQLTCLPSQSCLRKWRKKSDARVAEGVALRAEMKKANLWDENIHESLFVPIGKSVQYGTISAWTSWAGQCKMGTGFGVKPENAGSCDAFSGQCLFAFATDSEDLGDLEVQAQQRVKISDSQAHQAYTKLERFRRDLTDPSAVGSLHADQYLLSFAHILRSRFHRMQNIQDEYRQHDSEIHQAKDGALRVALHIRRADACSSTSYQDKPLSLDSHAQMSSVRDCFSTSVYVDALRRVHDSFGMPLQVFMATDDSKNVLDDISKADSNGAHAKGDNSLMQVDESETYDMNAQHLQVIEQFRLMHPDLYEKTSWRMLNYSRAKYKYSGMIETAKNNPFMTRTAVTELWHLSHGEVFVGHLGSRFGKVGYLLATARHNSPLPYISVDGHNVCCEVDEVCSGATEKLTNMADCLAYAHEQSHSGVNKDYWEKGSTIRTPVKLQRCDTSELSEGGDRQSLLMRREDITPVGSAPSV